jgi:ubiquinone/menaquinone biosynthesis C-methylase UbiE
MTIKIKETYLPGYSATASGFMASRRAESHARFLLPLLRPGLRLLDCGCGPGSITLDLARLVSPAEVIGCDLERSQVDIARNCAETNGITNVRFEIGSIYEVPFANNSFDVVFAHAVFEHLREPLCALAEIHRVLVPGGLVALRSPDWGGFLLAPQSEELTMAITYYQHLQIQSGGDVRVGRNLKALLMRASFKDVQFSASYECYESLPFIGQYLVERVERSMDSVNPRKREKVQRFATTLREWSRSEDGIFAQAWCEVIGTK